MVNWRRASSRCRWRSIRRTIGCSAAAAAACSAVSDYQAGKTITTLPIGMGVDGAGYDPATGDLFATNADGTLTVIHQDSADKYHVVGNVDDADGLAQHGTRSDDAPHLCGRRRSFAPPPAPARRRAGRPRRPRDGGARDVQATGDRAIRCVQPSGLVLEALHFAEARMRPRRLAPDQVLDDDRLPFDPEHVERVRLAADARRGRRAGFDDDGRAAADVVALGRRPGEGDVQVTGQKHVDAFGRRAAPPLRHLAARGRTRRRRAARRTDGAPRGSVTADRSASFSSLANAPKLAPRGFRRRRS